MNRLKTFLLCLCLILAAFPAAGSSDDNQNMTPLDETLIEEEIEESAEEPIPEVPQEEPIEPEEEGIIEGPVIPADIDPVELPAASEDMQPDILLKLYDVLDKEKDRRWKIRRN